MMEALPLEMKRLLAVTANSHSYRRWGASDNPIANPFNLFLACTRKERRCPALVEAPLELTKIGTKESLTLRSHRFYADVRER